MKIIKNILRCIVDAGYQAIVFHKISHRLYKNNQNYFALLVSRINRTLTGIEIEPGAILSDSVIISHGTGTVIGYGAVLGENVLIRQNVTIGRTGTEIAGRRAHPQIGNNVKIGAGAVIIGDIYIGDNVTIGANAVITKSVTDNAVVVGIPGRILKMKE